MNKALSQYQVNNPAKLFDQLLPTEKKVLTIIAEWSSNPRYRLGGFTLSQISIAEMVGVTRQTVNGIFSKFRQLGLIETVRRFNNSSVTKITSWWGTSRVQQVLPQFFKRFPIFSVGILSVMLLFSETKKASGRIPDINSFRSGIYGYKDSYLKKGSQRSGSERQEMKQKIERVKGIVQALLKRGETEVIDPYKLMGMSNEILDYAVGKLKYATSVKHPYRFFLKCCLEECRRNNVEPDWLTVDRLREQRLPEFEYELNTPAERNGSGTVSKQYDHRNPDLRTDKSNEQIVAEISGRQKREEEESRRRMDLYRAKSPWMSTEPDLNNPFMKIRVASQTARLEEVPFDSDEAREIRIFLQSVGIVV